MLDPPATAAARDEPAEGGIPPTLSQRVLLTLPESSLDVALAASLESKAASRAKIWKGILARSAPSLAAVAALPPPTGAGSDPSEPSPWSTPQTSPSLAAASSRGGGVPSARREASFGVRIKRTLTAAHWKVPDIIPLQASLVHHRKVPFKGLVVCWQLLLGTLGGAVLYSLESRQSGLGLADAFFTAFSAGTCTGLATFNITAFGGAAKALLATLMVCGSSILISAVPLHLRHAALRRNVPPGLKHVELKELRRCPEWLVELNSMRLLLCAIYTYQAVLLLLGFLLIYAAVASSPPEARGVCSYPRFSTLDGQPAPNATELPCRPGQLAAFVSIAAFANAGMTTEPGSLESFNENVLMLWVIAVLVLAGNVLYPVLLRWSIRAYLWCIPIDDARRLWARHLLLSGRKMYGFLFSTEQTTLLLLTQLAVWLAQAFTNYIFLVHEPWRGSIRVGGNLSELVECDEDPDCRNEMRAALPDDLFMSVQTRHAGFALYSLANENTPVLAMYMLAMMMAPVPLMIAVHSSSRRVSGRAHGTDEAAAREVDDGGGPAEPLTVAERLAGHRAQRWAERATARVRLRGELGGASDGVAEACPPQAVPDVLSRDRMAAKIDQLSLALARLPSHASRSGSGSDRTSSAGSVADLGVLQLQTMLWRGQVTWRHVLRHHFSAAWRAIVSFIGGPTLQRDLLFAWMAWFVILATDPEMPHGAARTAFDALFEVCSAFGNVGLSMGYSLENELSDVRPSTPQWFIDSLPPGEVGLSFCAGWPPVAKAMLVVVMIYGRTRALPQQVDYALTLAIEIPPSDKSPLQHRSRGVSGGFFTAAAVDRSPVELLLNPGGERDARSDELDSTRARGSWLFSQADLRSLCRSSHASASSSLHSSLHGSFKASSRVSHRLPSLERLLTPRGASRAAASPAIYGSLSAPAAVEAERGAAAAPTAAEAKAAAPSRVREALPRVTERSWWDFSGRSSARPESAASQSEAAGRHSHAARLEPEAAIEEDEEEEEDEDEAPGQAPAAAGGLRHYLSQFTGLGWLRLAASPAAAAVATDAGRGVQQLYDGVGVSGERPGSSKVVTLGDLVNADISDDSSAYSSARGSARQSQTSRELV